MKIAPNANRDEAQPLGLVAAFFPDPESFRAQSRRLSRRRRRAGLPGCRLIRLLARIRRLQGLTSMAGDPRTEPVSVKVLLTTGEGVVVKWRDGHESRYPFPYLRQQCPCATCRERRARGQNVTGTPIKTALPVFQEPVRALQAEPVGQYAVRFAFSDSHTTGIYSFDYFREICPCADCQAAREGGDK